MRSGSVMTAWAKSSMLVLMVCCLVLPTLAGPLQTLVEQLQTHVGKCILPEVAEVHTCEGEIKGTEALPGTSCPLTADPNLTSVYTCHDSGFWIERSKGTLVHLQREKRACKLFLLAVPVTGWIACAVVCNDCGPPPNSPPTIHCPDSVPTFQAEEGKATALVSWQSPTADDKEDGDLSSKVVLKTPVKPGSEVAAGVYTVVYDVRDSRGAMDYCMFQITVQVFSCERKQVPVYGWLSYSSRQLVWGTQCTVSCEEGYVVEGPAAFTCERNELWSPSDNTKCTPRTCPTLPSVDHGSFVCEGPQVYQTVCLLNCDPGYIALGPAIICQRDGMFTNPGNCVDDTKPEFPSGCPPDMEVIAAPPGQLTRVSWTPPNATDNAGNVTLSSTKSPGDGFSVGSTSVTYTATDAAGKVASCRFQVTVTTMYCEEPTYDNSSSLMVYDCPDGYVAGANCTVSCLLDYPKVGPDVIFCELNTRVSPPTTHWSTRDPNGLEPACQMLVCPPLAPPKNGALTCENWQNGPMCTYLCNANYDIPYKISGNPLFVCSTSNAIWRPSSTVPDCTDRRNPNKANIANELYYFTGDCQNAMVQEQIKENFIRILQQLQYSVQCPTPTTCVTSMVSVTCGPVGRRRRQADTVSSAKADPSSHPRLRSRRSADAILVDFTLSVDFADGSDALENAVRQKLQSLANSGGFDMTVGNLSLVAEDFTMASTRYSCLEGTFFNPTSMSCAGCATGTYYNATEVDCLDCPVGFYQNESFAMSCIPCPPHRTTNSSGKRSSMDCLPLCQPGHSSPWGVEPCQPCAAGSFQPDFGQTSCLSCPANHSTPSTASTASSSCLVLDACLSGPCGNHSCQQGASLGEFICTCQDGWSGVTCQTPPDLCKGHLCQNGATCVRTADNYTCSCATGFYGVYCQEPIVDGVWSPWTDWSQCSVTCGGGTRSRQRSCDSPPPGPHGQTCGGPSQDTDTCNAQDCPVCPSLKRPYGVVVNCTESDDVTTCTVTCREGLAFAEAPLPKYECGRVTNYTWNHQTPDFPDGWIFECSPVKMPVSAVATTTVQYGPCENLGSGNDVENQIKASVQTLDCVEKNICTPVVSMTGCDVSSRRKRSTAGSWTVAITLSMGTQGGVLELAPSENNTLTAESLAYVLDLLSVDASAQSLSNNTNDILTVNVGGKTFAPTSIDVEVQLSCPAGSVPRQGVCADCPRGTRQEGERCVLCDVGFYQSQTAQTSCLACPPGWTTATAGSTHAQNCSVASLTAPSTNSGSEDEGSVSHTLAIALGVVASVVVITAAIVVIVILQKKALKKGRVSDSLYDLKFSERNDTPKCMVTPKAMVPPPYSP